MRIFISGPMTGLPQENYPAFNKEAKRLRKLGHHVENPAENPRQKTWEAYMKLSLGQMLTCEVVVILPGWTASRGAMKEITLATELKMPIFDAGASTFDACNAPPWELS